MSVGYELVSLLAKNVKQFVFILGNHDFESNSYQYASSVIGYDSIQNVHLIKEPTDGILNSKHVLFVPWGFSSKPMDSKCSFLFGHFNLPNSCIRYNQVSVSNLDDLTEDMVSINDIREFCNDCLDIGGIGFSGHIHCRTEQTYKQNRIIFVGSPFEMTFGEMNSPHGFYVLDSENNISFEETKCDASIPKHVVLRLSDCFDNDGKIKDKKSFANLKGNIVKKIIDKDLTSAESMKLNELLNSLKIFEFGESEYGSLMNSGLSENGQQQTIDNSSDNASMLTLDSYFDTVIQAIDDNTLQSANVTKEELKECFLSYVSRVNGLSELT